MATPVRTTVRMSLNALHGEPVEPATIYYLKTETPHLYDFSMFGPFSSREAIVPSIKSKLRHESPAGLDMFDDILSTGPNALSSFEHIIAPLAGNRTMKISLVKEQNSEVAAILPGPTWIVLCAEPLPTQSGGSGGMELKDLTICGAFVSAQKANQALRLVVADKLRGSSGGMKRELPKEDGTMACVVKLGSKVWLVESKFESGAGTFEE